MDALRDAPHGFVDADGEGDQLAVGQICPRRDPGTYNAPWLGGSDACQLVFHPFTLGLPVWVMPPVDAVMSPALLLSASPKSLLPSAKLRLFRAG